MTKFGHDSFYFFVLVKNIQTKQKQTNEKTKQNKNKKQSRPGRVTLN